MARGRVHLSRVEAPGEKPMLTIIVALVVVGVILWCVNEFIPMDAKIKRILSIVVVVAVVIWLLNVFGVFTWIDRIPVGPRR